jgi:hypothetical protein
MMDLLGAALDLYQAYVENFRFAYIEGDQRMKERMNG